ncbi:B3 domain-containing protein, DNA-binding pseudobarrel domain protein [Tanacetum coccineum]
MQIYKHQKVASSSRRPHKLVNDEDDEDDEEEYNMTKKQRNKASSSKHPHNSIKNDSNEEYNMKKKQRYKSSSSKHPHKSVKDDSNEDNNTKNKPKKKIEPIISNDITERLKEHITHQLNGTNIMLVIQKLLFTSDLAGSQNRLSMPCNQLETSNFLTEHEVEYPLTAKSEIDNKNDLKQGETIQVWSYRKEDQNELCLAIAVVQRVD